MANFSFDIKHTNIAKGFFILAMVFHHVFAIQMNFWVNFSSPENSQSNLLLMDIAAHGKVCVGGFCFLSAYGITKKLTNCNLQIDNYTNLIITRLSKLYFTFWPIYIIGLIGTCLWGNAPVTQIYSSPSTAKFSWIYALIDAFGLAEIFSTNTLNRTWWYMIAAILIIILTPLLHQLYLRYKFIFAIIVIIFPYVFGTNTYNILFTISMLGIVFAQEDLLSKLKSFVSTRLWLKITSYFLTPILIFFTYVLGNMTSIIAIMPFTTLACILFSYLLLSDIPLLQNTLAFFGKHSANIFYVHSFLFISWFTYSIYSLHNKLLIYSVVFGGSLFISVVLELGKKIVRYNKLEQFVISHLTHTTYK